MNSGSVARRLTHQFADRPPYKNALHRWNAQRVTTLALGGTDAVAEAVSIAQEYETLLQEALGALRDDIRAASTAPNKEAWLIKRKSLEDRLISVLHKG